MKKHLYGDIYSPMKADTQLNKQNGQKTDITKVHHYTS